MLTLNDRRLHGLVKESFQTTHKTYNKNFLGIPPKNLTILRLCTLINTCFIIGIYNNIFKMCYYKYMFIFACLYIS